MCYHIVGGGHTARNEHASRGAFLTIMKSIRPSMTRLTGVGLGLLVLLAGPTARAFHDKGVASCASCHVTHGERDGDVLIDGGEALLVAASPSDVCLMCHGGQGGVFGENPLTPPVERGAGNFVFLLEDNINDGPDGLTQPIAGEAAGHSIVAPDRGADADTRFTEAPGGTYPSAWLGCTSCHDPHGNDNFRMLYGVGEIQGGRYQFSHPAPTAVGLPPQGFASGETPESHTAYRAGMSDWCANCHGRYHEEQVSVFQHPTDSTLSHGTARNYNNYDGTRNPGGGTFALAYLPEVPFEDTRAATTSTIGPIGNSRVMCLSCHRAHASSAPAAGRWDFHVSLLEDDGEVSGSFPLPNPYGDPEQGPLCEKCHLITPGTH